MDNTINEAAEGGGPGAPKQSEGAFLLPSERGKVQAGHLTGVGAQAAQMEASLTSDSLLMYLGSRTPMNPNNMGVDQALKDGEDYELLFTIPMQSQMELETTWTKYFPDLKLTQIGHLTEKTPLKTDTLEGGWDHFKQES